MINMKLRTLIVALLPLVLFAGCKKEPQVPQVVPGVFSVSETKQVQFTRSNLAEDGISFVSNAWDYGGYFGWGTGSNPTNTARDWHGYQTFEDWGKTIGDGWRTLTAEEWLYVLSGRKDAGTKRATGTVNGVHGLILLPDTWRLPENGHFTAGLNKWEGANNYSDYTWQAMEGAGAVFLPAAGYRCGATVDSVGVRGSYWSSTPCDEYDAYTMFFHENRANVRGNYLRDLGLSVRLVRDNN